MSRGFVGREAELARLSGLFDRIRDTGRDRPGVALLLRGRRRIGKSRLVDVFCERSGAPFVYFQADQGADAPTGRAGFALSVRDSDLPDRDLFPADTAWSSWSAVFRQLAAVLPDDAPSIVVIDELPWLMESDPSLEGVLQTAWDRLLSAKPVMLILVGSDLAMMERLDDYRRPFHQRGTVMVLNPLTPAAVGDMLDLPPAEAIDAYLVTGGLPLVCQRWRTGQTLREYLTAEVSDPTSALLVSGERSLAAEFPVQARASQVLGAIGSGERTWTGIRSAVSAGTEPLAASSLTGALDLLVTKRLVAIDTPLSTRHGDRDRRYRVADAYLRFYLAFLRDGLSLVERGRPDLVLRKIRASWTAWRGRAVEPLVREALLRIAPDSEMDEVGAVGGWWNRRNNPEIDLIGADRDGVARRVLFAGSIKWHGHHPFDRHDHHALIRDMAEVPGVDEATETVAVSRAGAESDLPVRAYGPADLIRAWRT